MPEHRLNYRTRSTPNAANNSDIQASTLRPAVSTINLSLIDRRLPLPSVVFFDRMLARLSPIPLLCVMIGCAAPAANPPTAQAHPPPAQPRLEPQELAQQQVSLAAAQACFVDEGHVWCWGEGLPVLGRSMEDQILAPTQVNNVPPAVSLATGGLLTCAITRRRELWCWGRNMRPVKPHPIEGISNVVQFCASNRHRCARTGNGKTTCWGDGQLGVQGPSNETVREPRRLKLVDAAVDMAISNGRTCVVENQGRVRCLGRTVCERGRNTDIEWLGTPVDLDRLFGAQQIAVSDRGTCGRFPDGTIRCLNCLLGSPPNPEGSDDEEPATQSLRNVIKVALADHMGCVVLHDGTVRCWEPSIYASNPVKETKEIPGIRDAVDVDVAKGRACVKHADGAVSCWGNNEHGRLGLGSLPMRDEPHASPQPVRDVSRVWAATGYTCILQVSGRLACTQPSTTLGERPWQWVEVTASPMGMAAGSDGLCVIEQDGSVRCGVSQVTDGTIRLQQIFGIRSAKSAAMSSSEATVIDAKGRIFAFDASSEVDPDHPIEPVQVIPGGEEVATGEQHMCVRDRQGSIHCWGNNDYGQLGNGSREPHAEPTVVTGIIRAKRVVASGSETCVIDGQDQLRCWGRTRIGLDEDPDQDPIRPGKPLLANVRDVSISWGRGCAVRKDQTLWCWGVAGTEPGDPDMHTAIHTPVHVSQLHEVRQVSVGADHTCAVLNDGELRCWGSNAMGQLGDHPVTVFHPSPERVWSPIHEDGSSERIPTL